MTAATGATLSERFVQVAAEQTKVGPTIRRAAGRTLFDFAGCARGGWTDDMWPEGRAGRLALAAHRLDLDDLHLGSFAHPGGVVWSAAVACAGEATFEAVAAAAAFGYELVVRLAAALGPGHRRFWHSTATAGTVGAAGAASLLLDADPVAAVGHALSVASGSSQAMAELSGTRFLHRAIAAQSGVSCARAAASGLPSSQLGLEGGRGLFTFGVDTAFADDLLAPHTTAAIEETGFRLLAATGFAHAAIGAALELAPLEPDTVAWVRATVSPGAGVALASRPEPNDDDEAWWSIEHAISVCLSTGDPDALGARCERADVLALCRRVELVPGDAGWGASVEVGLRDGEVRMAAVDGPRGHGDLGAEDADLGRKWQRVTGTDGDSLLAALLAGDGTEPFRHFAELLLPDELV